MRFLPLFLITSISLLFVPARPAGAIVVLPEYYPDPVTVADSARGIVLARCLRANSRESPALFVVYAHLGGSVPDTFSADPTPIGQHGERKYILGVHYALILGDPSPPAGPEVRKALAWRPYAQLDVWHDEWAGDLSDSSRIKIMPPRPGHPDQDTTYYLRAYRVMWDFARQTREEQRKGLASLMPPGSAGGSWVAAALDHHPDLWGEPIRRQYLDRLDDSKLEFFMREWAARQLAKHPDRETRNRILAYAKGDTLGRTLAVLLCASDETPWVRKTLLQIADQMSDSIPDPLANARARRGRPGAVDYQEEERMGNILKLFMSLIEALDPRNVNEREALLHIARTATTRSGLWLRVLHRIQPDTSRVASDMAWQTLEDAPRSGALNWEDGPRAGDVLQYLNRDDLNRALHDPRPMFRYYSYQEIARRNDPALVDTMLAWLRQNREGRRELEDNDVAAMLEAIGESRREGAFDEIAARSSEAGRDRRITVIKALTFLGDRRGAAILRSYAGSTPCGSNMDPERFLLTDGLQAIGDVSDTAMLIRWARECPSSRRASVEAIGVLAGIPTMVRVMLEVEPQPMKPDRAREYEWTEASVRRQLALSVAHSKP